MSFWVAIVSCQCYPYCLCSGFSSLTSHNKQQYCKFLYLFGKDVNVPQMWMWLDIQFQNLNICWTGVVCVDLEMWRLGKTILEDDSDVIVVNEWYELMFDFLTLFVLLLWAWTCIFSPRPLSCRKPLPHPQVVSFWTCLRSWDVI